MCVIEQHDNLDQSQVQVAAQLDLLPPNAGRQICLSYLVMYSDLHFLGLSSSMSRIRK